MFGPLVALGVHGVACVQAGGEMGAATTAAGFRRIFSISRLETDVLERLDDVARVAQVWEAVSEENPLFRRFVHLER